MQAPVPVGRGEPAEPHLAHGDDEAPAAVAVVGVVGHGAGGGGHVITPGDVMPPLLTAVACWRPWCPGRPPPRCAPAPPPSAAAAPAPAAPGRVEGQLSYRGLYVHAVRIHVPAEGLPQLRLAGGVPRHLADQTVLQTLLGGMAKGEVACMDSVLPSAAASTRLWPAMAPWARSAADSIPGEAAVS